jgi:hypothetical protein
MINLRSWLSNLYRITARQAVIRALYTMILMGIFPPLLISREYGPMFSGYGFIFSFSSLDLIDTSRLLVEWGVVCFIAAVYVVKEKWKP